MADSTIEIDLARAAEAVIAFTGMGLSEEDAIHAITHAAQNNDVFISADAIRATLRTASDRSEDLAGARLPTKAELLTYALQEHRALVAAEIARHLSNTEAEIRRHREALAHYDHVFALRLTGATSGKPTADGT